VPQDHIRTSRPTASRTEFIAMLENLPKYVVLSFLLAAFLAYIRAFAAGSRILPTGGMPSVRWPLTSLNIRFPGQRSWKDLFCRTLSFYSMFLHVTARVHEQRVTGNQHLATAMGLDCLPKRSITPNGNRKQTRTT
jgi:hypothetical protein